MSERATYNGTGKRKTSVARVILRPGDGTTWFNGRTIEQYFPRATHRELALSPLKVAGAEGTFDVRVRAHGGGPSGQAGAVRHGIARALVEADPELRVPLKRAGFLTRDARIVERKKAGLHKARKAPQFSKRRALGPALLRDRWGPRRRWRGPDGRAGRAARARGDALVGRGPRLRRPRHARVRRGAGGGVRPRDRGRRRQCRARGCAADPGGRAAGASKTTDEASATGAAAPEGRLDPLDNEPA